ncbi:hypothetical protein C8J57DRAFT_1721651, partial [Mycena rebaudengoi]
MDRAFVVPHPCFHGPRIPVGPSSFLSGIRQIGKICAQHAHIGRSPRADFALRVLSSCSGIRKLTLFGSYPTMLPALDKMQLRQLSVDLLELFGIPAINPARP